MKTNQKVLAYTHTLVKCKWGAILGDNIISLLTFRPIILYGNIFTYIGHKYLVEPHKKENNGGNTTYIVYVWVYKSQNGGPDHLITIN